MEINGKGFSAIPYIFYWLDPKFYISVWRIRYSVNSEKNKDSHPFSLSVFLERKRKRENVLRLVDMITCLWHHWSVPLVTDSQATVADCSLPLQSFLRVLLSPGNLVSPSKVSKLHSLGGSIPPPGRPDLYHLSWSFSIDLLPIAIDLMSLA